MKWSRFSGKKLKILLHVVIWVVLFIIPTYLVYGDSPREQTFMREVWFQLACYGVIFYLSYGWLAPGLFFTGKRVAFFVSTSILIIVFTTFLGVLHAHFDPVFHPGIRNDLNRPAMEPETGRRDLRQLPPGDRPPPPVKNWPIFNFLLTSCMVTGLSLGLRFSEKLVLNEKLRKEAEKEKLHTELSLLKHQINPHFLFNTLNSIYSLALIKSDLTAEAVMKLSDMMHYVMQDVALEMVPLELELEYLDHYVDLQKLRLNEKADVSLHVEGDPAGYEIPPMILVPFIENAFKYGTSSHENTVIRVDLAINEGSLSFKVFNRIFTGREKTETFGIGIQNTRKRLDLIYPGRYTLDLENNGSVFIVNLEISFA